LGRLDTIKDDNSGSPGNVLSQYARRHRESRNSSVSSPQRTQRYAEEKEKESVLRS
jgi:hypothetical protein